MDYIPLMTNTTQSFDPAPFVCVNCGHEHHYEDDTIVCEGKIFCEDEEACERRMARWPRPDHDIDWSDPPEERSLSTEHLEEQASARYEDRYGSWDDYDGPDDGRWDD